MVDVSIGKRARERLLRREKRDGTRVAMLLREALAKLTDDQIDEVRARKDIVVGKAQAQYGGTKEKAARKMDEYLAEQ
jgi:uncharacterized protein YjbJ (UPF0337 family)